MNRLLTRRAVVATVGSFFVYLLPIAGPHAAFLVGEFIANGISADRSAAWTAADIGFALTLQALAFTILFWALKKPRRLAVFVVILPGMWIAAQAMYLVIIPSYFLIEADSAPELTTATERCVVEKASLVTVRVPVDLPTLPVEEWWLQYPDGRYGMLKAADCSVTMATLPQPTVRDGRADFILGFAFYVPGRGAIVERLEPPTGRRTWWLQRRSDAALEPLAAPAGQETPPILSNDGAAVVWQRRIPARTPPVLTELIVQRLMSTEPDQTIDLTPLGPGSYTLASADTLTHALLVWRDDALLVVGFDGVRRGSDRGQTGVRPGSDPSPQIQPGTYRVGPDGSWLAWDAYRENGPYRLAWMTDRGGGLTLPRGRAIIDAAFDPTRKHIAYSASTALSIGDTQDLLAIVGADDGRDVFRRYLPRYSRSGTVFFSDGTFGYSDDTGTHVITVGR